MADGDVEKVKDRLSIVDVVGQYVQLRRAGRNYSARCPFHKERTPSFMVSPERGTYVCFGCGEKGDIFSFVEKIEGVDFRTALEQLAQKAGVKLERNFVPKAPGAEEKEERLRAICEEATNFFENTLATRPDIATYLESRGVHKETVTNWRLGYAPAQWESLSKHLVERGYNKDDIVDAGLAVRSEKKQGEIFDRFRGRVMFPMFDQGGKVIAFSGRFFEKVPGQKEDVEPAKYVNSPETALFKKSKVLYGLDRAKAAIRRADCILLVEGQFDLILSHQSGLPFAVASSGTAITPEHLSLLSRFSKRLVLALDGDAAGIRAGLRTAQMAIAGGFEVKIPTFPGGKDPADLAKENPELLKAAIRTSKTAVEFFLDALRPGAKDERAYQKLVEEHILPLIAGMGSTIEQEHFVRVVAGRLGVSEGAVRTEVGKKPISSSEFTETSSKKEHNREELLPAERLAGMLLFRYEPTSAVVTQVEALLGRERTEALKTALDGRREELQFLFDAEVGEGEEANVAQEILLQLERLSLDEEMRRVAGDPVRIAELARRLQALRR